MRHPSPSRRDVTLPGRGLARARPMRKHRPMQFRVEPSPAGGYVVRLAGEDVPVSRHDTEEEAEEWVARHAGGVEAAAGDPPRHATSVRPHFVGLEDGTQILVRSPRPDDGERVRDALLVAIHPASGEIVGAVDRGGAWAAPAWAGRGLEPVLRSAA